MSQDSQAPLQFAQLGLSEPVMQAVTAIGYETPSPIQAATIPAMLEGRDVKDRPWFTGGRQGSFIGDPHHAKLLAPLLPTGPDGEPPRFVDVAVPVFDASGAVNGVLGAHLYWDWAQAIVTTALDDVDKTGPIEILIANPAVRNIIREGKSHQLDAVIQTGAEFGMQSMDKTLVSLIHNGTITYDEARNFAVDIDELDRLMRG